MRSLFLLFVSLPVGLTACGDDESCGFTDEPASVSTELSAGADVEAVIYGEWFSSPNNDCGEPGGPISLTVEGKQEGVANRSMVFCLPRPDKLGADAVDIGTANRVQLIDVFAETQTDCLWSYDRTRETTGTVAFPGICEDGQFEGGYALELDLTVPVSESCDGSTESTEGTIRVQGTVRVEALSF